jgi:hypothetical protein
MSSMLFISFGSHGLQSMKYEYSLPHVYLFQTLKGIISQDVYFEDRQNLISIFWCANDFLTMFLLC